MSLLKKFLIPFTGNSLVQKFLEKSVADSQYFMGVGSGSGASSSGEKAIFDLLEQKTRPPYCIFDIGSNKGQFLKLILDNISTDAFTIHCFEPGHETFKILADSFQDDSRINLNNKGIGKENGEAVLHYDFVGSGLASLTKRKLEHYDIDFDKSETVFISTIDNYCSENEIEHIHLLKIDIEGHELDALAGAQTMFEKKSIDIVTFEFGGCNIDTRSFFQDFWYFFSKTNMKLFRIAPSGYLVPIKAYNEIHEQFRTTNFIALTDS